MDVLPLALAALIGLVIGLLIARRPTAGGNPATAPVRESLDRFGERLRALESSRIEWHAQLREQVESVRRTSELLRRETASLATALRRPQVRGRWGEMHLRRAVELAGLVEQCDFEQQATRFDGDTTIRPDLVVHLAGDKQVIVDSKVPLDAFLDAVDAGADQDEHLLRHARQLRSHVDALSRKAYWRQFDQSPEFVVLFVPGEAFLSAALEADPSLLDHAAQQRIVLATPTTLIALLRTVAYAWTQDQLAGNARELHALARELYERLGTLGGHIDKLGRSLTTAVGSYNRAVASLESRVLVSARRLSEVDIAAPELPPPHRVEDAVRPLTATELLEADPEPGDPDAARRVG